MRPSLIAALILLVSASLCPAAGRVALVIGNNACQHMGRLGNPQRDAAAVAGVLRTLKFDVETIQDATVESFYEGLEKLKTRAAGAELALVYFAGQFEAALPGGGEMAFRYCPPGNFMMGSPATEKDRDDDENQVPVRITRGFWLAETECTQGQWQAVMKANPSHFSGSPQLPVEQVSRDEVQVFLGNLNRAGGLPAGWKWALPTEAQWEYACRVFQNFLANEPETECFDAGAVLGGGGD